LENKGSSPLEGQFLFYPAPTGAGGVMGSTANPEFWLSSFLFG